MKDLGIFSELWTQGRGFLASTTGEPLASGTLAQARTSHHMVQNA